LMMTACAGKFTPQAKVAVQTKTCVTVNCQELVCICDILALFSNKAYISNH
jgi:hypothetical protein